MGLSLMLCDFIYEIVWFYALDGSAVGARVRSFINFGLCQNTHKENGVVGLVRDK